MTFKLTGSRALQTQWFGDTFADPLYDSNTLGSDRRSDTTNTMVLKAASSKRIEIYFARRNNYFQRSTKSLKIINITHVTISALGDAQTLRIQWFERWLFSIDEACNLSAIAFSGTTNTVV